MAEQRRGIDRGVYFALLLFAGAALTLWALGLLLAPFAAPIAWALCFLTVTGGLYRRLEARVRRPRLSSLLMTLATALVLVVPLVAVGFAVAKEAADLASRVREQQEASEKAREAEAPDAPPAAQPAAKADPWDRFFADRPRLDEWRAKVDGLLGKVGTDTKKLRDAALSNLSGPFAGGAMAIARDVFLAAFGFLIMLVTLYFLYRDGGKIRALVVDVTPLEPGETERLLDILRATVFAALVGGLLTALIQGTLGGIAFAVTGVRAFVLWGLVMAVLSLFPFGGAAFVWLPVAIYFLVTGKTWQGWFLIGWGVLVVGLADNLFRPLIMRRAGAGDIHPLLLFFAILSGIAVFGISGIVFGPLLIAIVLGLIRIYREHFGKGRAARVGAPTAAGPPATSAGAS